MNSKLFLETFHNRDTNFTNPHTNRFDAFALESGALRPFGERARTSPAFATSLVSAMVTTLLLFR